MLSSLRAAFTRHRPRIAKLALLLTVLAAASELLGAMPQTVDLDLDLGGNHAIVRKLRVAYVQDGDEVQVLQLSYPSGAPRRVEHDARLGPGRYELRVELVVDGDATPRGTLRRLEVPTEGEVRVDLHTLLE